MNLREQITEILSPYKKLCTLIMRSANEAEILSLAEYCLSEKTDIKILSLPVEGVEIKEKCSHYEYICVSNCGDCEYLSGSPSDRECVIEGIIRRPATLQEVVDRAKEGKMVVK